MLSDSEFPSEIRDLEAEYHILGELGRGGMAVVYLARDRALGRAVAIKVIRAKYVEDAEAMARFAREARTVAQLQHPNIVTLYAVRQLQSNGLALVMQYVPGRTLKEAIREDGPLPPSRVDQVLRDVGAALTYAHQHGVVHRDVKPENIFLDETSGRALLSDFGAALSVAEDEAQLTLVGTTIGTPAYMSPEQIDGSEIDDRSDMYSLALVGWEMLTGERPWSGASLYSVIYRQKHEELPPADGYRSDIPPGLLFAIEGALQKPRQHRWRNVEEFVAKLTPSRAELRRWRRQRRTVRTGAIVPERASGALPDDMAEAPTVAYRRPVRERGAAVDERPRPTAADERHPTAAPRRRSRSRLAAAIAAMALLGGGGAALWNRYETTRDRGITIARGSPSADAPQTTQVPIGGAAAPTDSMSGTAGGTVLPDTAAAADTGRPADSAARTDSAAPRAAAQDTAARDTAPRRDTLTRVAAAPPTGARSAAGRTAARRDSARTPPGTVARAGAAAAAAESGAGRRVPTPGPKPPPAGGVARTDTETRARPDSPATVAPTPPPTGPAVGPAPVSNAGSVLAGGMHSCLLTPAGEAYCWGSNDHGQLGTVSGGRQAAPVAVAGDLRFTALALGSSHSCAISRASALYCWGANDRGQLGDNSTTDRAAPVAVFGERRYRVVATALAHSCAVAEGGDTYCWGANDAGQLGDGSRSDRDAPARVAGAIAFTTVTVGWQHSCALDSEGRAYCWGKNGDGQLGVGGGGDRTTPTPVTGDLRFVRIAAGSAHSCALTAAGEAYCWGRNNYGQLGTGGPANEVAPARVGGGDRYVALAVGTVHSCALLGNGQARCWGRNSWGQLGDGTTSDRPLPVPVYGGMSFQRLTASGAHTCGVTAAGAVCWGYNVEGQLGDGSRSNRSRPTAVAKPSL
jgi:alpha-tubulin suppressor-like RCC1 family protein/tRNA A-37 threonylcarbamoyl transferase component Bud32